MFLKSLHFINGTKKKKKTFYQTVTTFLSNMSVLDQLILYTVRTKCITEEAELRTFQPSSDRPAQFRAGILFAPWYCFISFQFKIQYSTVTEHLKGTHVNLALLILLKLYFYNTLSFKIKLNLDIKIQWPRLIIPSQPRIHCLLTLGSRVHTVDYQHKARITSAPISTNGLKNLCQQHKPTPEKFTI